MTFKEFQDSLREAGTIQFKTLDNEGATITQYPSINFYGCAFNFSAEGTAESRYYNGNDIYNRVEENDATR